MQASAWSASLSKDDRQKLVHKVYDGLKALSGEDDAKEVWSAAAQFEMTTIQQAKSKEEYLKKIQEKEALCLQITPSNAQPNSSQLKEDQRRRELEQTQIQLELQEKLHEQQRRQKEQERTTMEEAGTSPAAPSSPARNHWKLIREVVPSTSNKAKQARMSQAKMSWLVKQQARLDFEQKKAASIRKEKQRRKRRKHHKSKQQQTSIVLLQNQIAELKNKSQAKQCNMARPKTASIPFSSTTASRFEVLSHHWAPMAAGNTEDDWVSISTSNRCVGPTTLFSAPKKSAVGEEDKPGGARMRRTSWVNGACVNLDTRKNDAEIRRQKLRKTVVAMQNAGGDGMASITSVRELRKAISLGLTMQQRALLRSIDKDGDGVISSEELNAFLVETEKRPLTSAETMQQTTFVGSMSPHVGKWGAAPFHGSHVVKPKRPVRWQDEERTLNEAKSRHLKHARARGKAKHLQHAKSCPPGMPTASSMRSFTRHVCNSHGIKCSGSDVFDYAKGRPKNEKKAPLYSPHRRRLSLFW